ncbi:hypothetical protein PVAP13_2KG404705 [Panicum virgatum]|uniref:Uncharacterized protein n=1 Tax=Panicum virgatum TaxID=38727 RepID=A0A8T0W6V3_PANVG|nr:hypothetical protein PVAP13_2KG404705 [Panicum virgatum]
MLRSPPARWDPPAQQLETIQPQSHWERWESGVEAGTVRTIFFHGGSTIGCGCGANGFSGDALWKITSLYGGVEEDGDGGDVGGGFLNSTAWRFFFLGCPLVLAASAPSLVVRP